MNVVLIDTVFCLWYK